MKKTTIENLETGVSKNCDILYKKPLKLEIVIEDTTIKVVLIKKDIKDEHYIGKISNMLFRSNGE